MSKIALANDSSFGELEKFPPKFKFDSVAIIEHTLAFLSILFMHFVLVKLGMLVLGPPQKCNVVSTQSYDGQSMNVAVSCPENGNSPITAYRIEYRLDGNGMTWKSREFDATILQPFVIDGLEPFESYNFRATARNKYGYEAGELSFNNVVTNTTAEDCKFCYFCLVLSIICFHILSDPGPPSIVSSSQNASRWLVVSWSLPDQPKGDPKYYFVYYQRVGLRQMRDTKRLNVTGTSVNLTMLSPFTWYSVEVAAVNVRSHDGKALEGQRSVARNFGTDEDGMFGNRYLITAITYKQ